MGSHQYALQQALWGNNITQKCTLSTTSTKATYQHTGAFSVPSGFHHPSALLAQLRCVPTPAHTPPPPHAVQASPPIVVRGASTQWYFTMCKTRMASRLYLWQRNPWCCMVLHRLTHVVWRCVPCCEGLCGPCQELLQARVHSTNGRRGRHLLKLCYQRCPGEAGPIDAHSDSMLLNKFTADVYGMIVRMSDGLRSVSMQAHYQGAHWCAAAEHCSGCMRPGHHSRPRPCVLQLPCKRIELLGCHCAWLGAHRWLQGGLVGEAGCVGVTAARGVWNVGTHTHTDRLGRKQARFVVLSRGCSGWQQNPS